MRMTSIAIALTLAAAAACTSDDGTDVVQRREAALAEFEAAGPVMAKRHYADLDASAKADLWHAQLARQLGSATLTSEQRAIVVELDGKVEAIIAGGMPEDLERRASAVFSFGEIADRFGRLGALDVSVPEDVNVGFASASTCDERWCVPCWNAATGGAAVQCGDSCTVSSSGCGWFWQQECNRMCEPLEAI